MNPRSTPFPALVAVAVTALVIGWFATVSLCAFFVTTCLAILLTWPRARTP